MGLGNPGKKYEATKHNVGFLSVDLIAQKQGVKIDRLKFKSLMADIKIEGSRCILMKPQTFMNNSGEAVRDAAHFYKIPPRNIVIIFDDISLPLGQLRIRRKGSDGGHNGIKSIIYHLNSDDFPRIKIGIGGKPHPDYDLASWVLSGFDRSEIEPMKEAFSKATGAVDLIISGKIDEAMNRFNG